MTSFEWGLDGIPLWATVFFTVNRTWLRAKPNIPWYERRRYVCEFAAAAILFIRHWAQIRFILICRIHIEEYREETFFFLKNVTVCSAADRLGSEAEDVEYYKSPGLDKQLTNIKFWGLYISIIYTAVCLIKEYSFI